MKKFETGGEIKKYHVGLLAAITMVFSLVAAGAYGVEEMVPACGPGMTIILLLVIPFIWGLPMGFVSAELGGARPVEGLSLIHIFALRNRLKYNTGIPVYWLNKII